MLPQPPMAVCKMEAQSEYVHVAHTFGTNLHAQSVLINKQIAASELSREFIKTALLVGTT